MNNIFFLSQFSYKADRIQLSFLQLLSKTAEQNITVHCKNMIIFNDAKRSNLKRAMKLMAYNDLELVADGNPRFSFETILDGCEVLE